MAFSLDDRYVVISYHYVREPDDRQRGIHPCSPEEFERQILFLSANYRITTVVEVFEGAQTGSREKRCALTFDDGTRDHFTIVAPILKRYRAPGTFFVITGTLEGYMPAVHKVHTLFSSATPDNLIELFHEFLKIFFQHDLDRFLVPTDTYINPTFWEWMHEDIRVANLKDTLKRLDNETREKFFHWVFEKLLLSEPQLSAEIYMDVECIRNLHRDGFVIGSHTHEHHSFDSIAAEKMQDEIQRSKATLVRLLGAAPTFFSYPYGALSGWDGGGAVRVVLQNEGFSHAVTFEPRRVEPTDVAYAIPRYDCNHIRDFIRNNSR